MITESDIQRFQALYEQSTGQKLTPEEALEYVESLVETLRLVYRPIKKVSVQPTRTQYNRSRAYKVLIAHAENNLPDVP